MYRCIVVVTTTGKVLLIRVRVYCDQPYVINGKTTSSGVTEAPLRELVIPVKQDLSVAIKQSFLEIDKEFFCQPFGRTLD